MSPWVLVCTLVHSTPLQVTKSGHLEYAAIEVAKRDHKLSFTMCIVSLKQRLSPATDNPFGVVELLPKDGTGERSAPSCLRQYVQSGQEFARFAALWAEASRREPEMAQRAAREVLYASRKVSRR